MELNIFWWKQLQINWICQSHLNQHPEKLFLLIGNQCQGTNFVVFNLILLYFQLHNKNKCNFINCIFSGQIDLVDTTTRKIPLYVKDFFLIPLNIWLFFIFVSGWICSFLVYLLSTFDSNYQSHHKRVDYFRALLPVTIPAYSATTSKFKPANFPNCIIYWLLLTCPMFFQSKIGAYLYQFMKYQFYYYQITSVDEIMKFPF